MQLQTEKFLLKIHVCTYFSFVPFSSSLAEASSIHIFFASPLSRYGLVMQEAQRAKPHTCPGAAKGSIIPSWLPPPGAALSTCLDWYRDINCGPAGVQAQRAVWRARWAAEPPHGDEMDQQHCCKQEVVESEQEQAAAAKRALPRRGRCRDCLWTGRGALKGPSRRPEQGQEGPGRRRALSAASGPRRSLRTNLVCPERRGRGNDSEFRRLLVSTLPGRGARSDLGRPGRAEAERTCSVNRQWSIGAAVRLCGGSRSIAVRRSIGSAVRLCGGSAVLRPSGAAVRSCSGSAVDRSLGQRAGGPVVAARRGESPIADR